MRFYKSFIRDYFSCTVLAIIYFFVCLFLTIQIPSQFDLENLDVEYTESNCKGCLDNTTDRVFWFLHVSDTHISEKSNPNGLKHFKEFVNFAKTVNASCAIATGDITNGAHAEDSGIVVQQKREWEDYHRIIHESNLTMKFFDVKGNHDNWGIANKYSSNNYYYQYSQQKEYLSNSDRSKIEKYEIDFEFGKYVFLSLDFNQYPGVSRPFGVFGLPGEKELNSLETYLAGIKSNHTILFGHHPFMFQNPYIRTSTKKSFSKLVRENRVLAYLTGHYHQPGMYSELFGKRKGLMELEVADLSWQRYFRICAIDNDIFSFIDLRLEDLKKPIALVTNPTDSKFLSSKEPLWRISNSEYLRVLIFEDHLSDDAHRTKSVEFQLFEEGKEEGATKKALSRVSNDHPLWVQEWDPTAYQKADGCVVKIILTLNSGEKIIKSQPFSVNGKQSNMGFTIPQIYQRLNIYQITVSLFVIIMIFCFVFLLIVPKIIKMSKFTTQQWKFFDKELRSNSNYKQMRFQKIVKFHFKYNFWKYARLSKKIWLLFFVSMVFLLFSPAMISPMITDNGKFEDGKENSSAEKSNSSNWGVAWILFGVYCNGTTHYHPSLLLFAVVFLSFIWFPILNLFSKIPSSSADNEVNPRTRLFRLPSFWVSLVFISIGFMMIYWRISTLGVYSIIFSFALIWNSSVLILTFLWVIVRDIWLISIAHKKKNQKMIQSEEKIDNSSLLENVDFFQDLHSSSGAIELVDNLEEYNNKHFEDQILKVSNNTKDDEIDDEIEIEN
ncbi:helicase related [Anaeramoeba flamelloides]|uniref:Helicase related n=1 Tax=Anaeramoeba flamelloides TaxID=1746091 RepID=A0AAV7YLA8_9EUKA|nr:helicase related [Anaeramoeba flamelloides]